MPKREPYPSKADMPSAQKPMQVSCERITKTSLSEHSALEPACRHPGRLTTTRVHGTHPEDVDGRIIYATAFPNFRFCTPCSRPNLMPGSLSTYLVMTASVTFAGLALPVVPVPFTVSCICHFFLLQSMVRQFSDDRSIKWQTAQLWHQMIDHFSRLAVRLQEELTLHCLCPSALSSSS